MFCAVATCLVVGLTPQPGPALLRASVRPLPTRCVATPEPAPRELGKLAVLLTVPAAWGTFAPAVKLAYAASPSPLPGLVFSTGQYFFATLTLLAAAAAVGKEEGGSLDAMADSSEPATRATWLAGLELGGYLFVANQLQVKGLGTIPADRGAFLVQTTTLVVPLLQALSEGGLASVPRRTWAACVLAFVGVLLMSAELDVAGGLSMGLSFGLGDLLVLASALLYSVHVLRLSALASGIPALRLSLAKACSEGGYSLLLLGGLALLPALPISQEIGVFAQTFAQLDAGAQFTLAASAAWCGVVTVAYTIWAQSYGQSGGISPTEANLVYTTQPLWSAAFAWLLLGELLTPSEVAGGLVIGAALWVATREDGPARPAE